MDTFTTRVHQSAALPHHRPAFATTTGPRRVIVAIVGGEAGARIQTWRTRHDPRQAQRLPPHATFCYRAPVAPTDLVEAQVRHALPGPLTVRIGALRMFDNPDRTRYLELVDTHELDTARERLFDGTHLPFPPLTRFTWHITCVRYAAKRDQAALDAACAGLDPGERWTLDRVAYLELDQGSWRWLARWEL